nr:trypsin-like peptidase domain-containing protein [Bacilli bacterium]
KTDKISFLSSKETKENKSKNIKLKHTDSVTVKSDGVYITDVSEVVDAVMPSIVSITSKTVISEGNFGPSFYGYNNSRSYTTEGAGSGVIVYEDDDYIYILTNNHVVDDASELSVKFINDKSYDAKVKGVSERKDIAIVYLSKKDIDTETLETIKIATLGNSNELKVGNGIIAIGNALGYGQSVTTGVVSALNREVSTDEYTQDMIQIDAAINGGNSGGALLNSKGEVIGINSVKYSSSASSSKASIEGMGFAIPISDVEELIKKLIAGENDTDGITLGIEGYMTSDMAYNLPDGFYISAIVKDSAAESSELEIGNIITEIDGNKVTSIDTIRKVLNKKEKGDKVSLKIKYVSRVEYKEKEIEVFLK